MPGLEFFDREIKLATQGLEPDQINAALAKFARRELARAISEGASPQYDRFVNGREGAPEESVRAPGPITYVFTNWPLVINAAIEELKKRTPRKSGRYQGSFIVIVGGQIVTDYASIKAGAEAIIVNFQPYTRKLDAGRAAGRRHFLGAYQALRRRFGDVFSVKNVYLNIQGGVHPMIPYVLKHGGRRKDRQAGMPITYPAIVINAL